MTDIADKDTAATAPAAGEYVMPIFGDKPEGTHVWQRVPYNADDYGPVTDFTSDFDHADPSYNPNAPEVWKELRNGGCPVAHSDRYGGMWVPITHDTVNEVAYDTEHFTSRSVVVSVGRPGDLALPAPIGGAPPITSDPPFHNMARRLLLPAFAPKKIEPWEPEIRASCATACSTRSARSRPAKPSSTPPCSTRRTSRSTSSAACSASPSRTKRCSASSCTTCWSASPKSRAPATAWTTSATTSSSRSATTAPTRATTSPPTCSTSRSKGSPSATRSPAGMIILLLIAGIDTTWSAIGSSLWHLAQHPEDHQRLLDDPDVMTFALEEFLRAYAPVTMARMVAKDTDFHGCPMKKDDWVLLPFPAANRDPLKFEDADTFIVDRQENRHAAFGLGIHRCLGSNLARLELKVAIEEFTKRFPRFELAGDTRWSVGQIRGPRELPVRILEVAG
jgi:cytochrome P450